MGLQIHQKKIYVIYRGRVDKPTIYSSWGHAHPKVKEFDGADYREFDQLEDAQNSLKEKGFEDYEKFLKPEGNASSSQPRGKHYAVAYGNMIGVFRDWKTAEKSIKGFKSACHQRFDTECEAREFIKDWNDSFAEIWCWAIKKGLCDGWKPKGLRLDLASILVKTETAMDPDENLLSKLEQWNVKDNTQN